MINNKLQTKCKIKKWFNQIDFESISKAVKGGDNNNNNTSYTEKYQALKISSTHSLQFCLQSCLYWYSHIFLTLLEHLLKALHHSVTVFLNLDSFFSDCSPR